MDRLGARPSFLDRGIFPARSSDKVEAGRGFIRSISPLEELEGNPPPTVAFRPYISDPTLSVFLGPAIHKQDFLTVLDPGRKREHTTMRV